MDSKAEEVRCLPQSTVDGILDDVSLLVESTISELGAEVESKLKESGIDPTTASRTCLKGFPIFQTI